MKEYNVGDWVRIEARRGVCIFRVRAMYEFGSCYADDYIFHGRVERVDNRNNEWDRDDLSQCTLMEVSLLNILFGDYDKV